MAAKPRITKRLVSSKRHTVGFVLTGGREITRDQAVSMASRNRLSNVRVVRSSQGDYLQSTTNSSLYSLPMVVVE